MRLCQADYLFILSRILFITAGLTSSGLCNGSNADSIQIGNEEQLFPDDYLIMNSSNIMRRMHPAQKYSGNPLVWPTKPWEYKPSEIYVFGSEVYSFSVIRDNNRYKMWYTSEGATRGVGYAESHDGITWVKPLLDNVIVDGQKTNLLFCAMERGKSSGTKEFPAFVEIYGVHKDDRDPDPSRRYKMGFLSIIPCKGCPREDPFHPGERRGLGVAGSHDGIHWKLIDPFTTDAIIDGDTHWMFDPEREKYVLYGRTKHTLPEVENAWSGYDWYKGWHWGRSVARIESDDFLHWDFTEPASAPVVMTADTKDEPGTEIYSMLVFPYESVYIGLIQVYTAHPDASYLDIQLAVSRDSYNFTRVGDRKPFIPLGPVGSWDRFENCMATNPPFVIGDELRFYYSCLLNRHSPYRGKDTGEGGGIGIATIKRGRFVSLEASFDGGAVTTKPLVFKGSQLLINANCRFGSIQVPLLDDKGNEIPGWTLTVTSKDDIAIPVSFEKGDLKKIAGQKISLRFTLSNAQLFGFRIN